MADKKIIWSERSLNEFRKIIEFYNDRNGNSKYSKKVTAEIKKSVSLLSKQPFLGKPTDEEGVRILIHKEFLIIYEILNSIIVLLIVDGRRDLK